MRYVVKDGIGTFRWSSGELVSDIELGDSKGHWKYGVPKFSTNSTSSYGSKTCVALNLETMKFEVLHCGYSLPYLCYTKHVAEIPVPTAQVEID